MHDDILQLGSAHVFAVLVYLDGFLVYAIGKRRTCAMLLFHHAAASNALGSKSPACSLLGRNFATEFESHLTEGNLDGSRESGGTNQ